MKIISLPLVVSKEITDSFLLLLFSSKTSSKESLEGMDTKGFFWNTGISKAFALLKVSRRCLKQIFPGFPIINASKYIFWNFGIYIIKADVCLRTLWCTNVTSPPVLKLWDTQGYLWLPYDLTEVINLIGVMFKLNF